LEAKHEYGEVIVRAATVEDAPSVLEIYRPYVDGSVVSFEYEVPAVEEIARRISVCQEKYPWLVALLNDEIVGYAYASDFRSREAYKWIPEVSVYVTPRAKGKGIAKQLYNELFEQLKALGMIAVFAGMTTPNPETERFHEKMGFKFSAKFEKIGFKNNAWHDVTFVRLEFQK
jgi:L-amino acid N-acyltransferase YncA